MNQIFTFISSFPVINVLYICTVINHPPELDKSMDKRYYNKYTENKLFLVDITN